jgi:perosamine synthetase
MLVTSDEQLASHARRLRNQGRDPALDWYQHAEVGFSYRLSDINCALGVSQLARIDAVIERRHKLAEIYDRELVRIAELIRPPLTSGVGRISWFVYPVQVPPEFNANDRDKICESLLRRGIATGRYFAPLHRQPVLKPYGNFPPLPQTELVADRVIALPFFNTLTEHEIQEVSGALEESMRELRRKI